MLERLQLNLTLISLAGLIVVFIVTEHTCFLNYPFQA